MNEAVRLGIGNKSAESQRLLEKLLAGSTDGADSEIDPRWWQAVDAARRQVARTAT